jgi:hypothetical protein
MRSQSRTFLILVLIMLVVGVLRFFMKGWVDALGIPEIVGSLIVSLNIVLLVGLVIFFAREGRAPDGRYARAAGWFVALAAWSSILIVTGILVTARIGTPTYYEEMVFAHRTLPTFQHAVSHAVAFVFVAVVGLLLGWPIYWVAKRGRPTGRQVDGVEAGTRTIA